MLNCTKEQAVQYIKENAKIFGGTMSQSAIGLYLGVTAARVNQMIKGLTPKPETV